MIRFDDPALQHIEREITSIYDTDACGYPRSECLLDIRRRLLNDQALTHESQEELLPYIIAFNDALREALKHMYDRAHELYHQISAIQPGIELIAKCYLAYKYPSLHPFQGEDRQGFFDAICDSGWNQLYADGVTFALELPRDMDMPFDTIRGMDCKPYNWNEGLDPELTKDLHINRAFHNLFDHTKFALTDFIFCRDFVFEFSTINEEKLLIR